MAEQPIDYTSGNGFFQGLQGAGLYHQVQQQKAQAAIAQQQQGAQQAFQKDWQAAYSSNDPAQMNALVAKYPGQIEAIKNGLNLRDDQHQKEVNGMANDLSIAQSQGTPQAIAQALVKHANTLQSIGSTPQEAMQMAISNPDQLKSIVQAVKLSTMSPEKQFDVQDKQQTQELKRDSLSETIRRNDQDNSRGWASVNIAQQNANLRKMELQDKAFDRQIARETNQAKLSELYQKQEMNQQKLTEAKEKTRLAAVDDYKRVDTISGGYDRISETAKRIMDNPSLWRATGAVGKFYNVPGSNAANIDAEIQSLKSQVGMQMLSAMKELSANGASGLGNTSNREYEGLQSSLSSLEQKQSPEQFRKSLNRIIDYSKKSKDRLNASFKESYPNYQPQTQQPTQQQSSGGYSNLWGN